MEVSTIKTEVDFGEHKVKEENSASAVYEVEVTSQFNIKTKSEDPPQILYTSVTKEEIDSAIYNVKPDKNPTSDGLKLEPESIKFADGESQIDSKSASDEEHPEQVSQTSQARSIKIKINRDIPKQRKKSVNKIQRRKLLQCTLCPQSFSRVNLLITHVRNEHEKFKNSTADFMSDDEDETSLQCPLCSKSLSSVTNLERHFLTFHLKEKSFQCNICLKSRNEIKKFPTKQNLDVHIAMVHDPARFKFQCDVCSKKIICRADYKKHKETHIEKKYKCEYCSKAYRDKEGMLRHIIAVHKEYTDRHETFKCDECEQLFCSKREMECHVLQAHVEDTVQCKICFKKFREEGELRKHSNVAHRENRTWLVCDVCSKVFKNNKDLVQHLEVEHKRFFKCRKCFRSFESKEDYDDHSTGILGKDGKPVKRFQLQCKICLVFLSNECSFTTHKDTHLKTGEIGIKNVIPIQPADPKGCPLKCDFCPTTFQNKSLVLKHAMECHPNEKLECKTCAKSFQLKYQLNKHELIHSVNKLFECTVCKKCFTSLVYLMAHERTHKKHKKYKCRQCEEFQSDGRGLRMHMASHHGGEKPYKCRICKRAFAVKYHLDQHSFVHTNERPFSCSKCFYASKCAKELRAHQKRMHSENSKYKYTKGMSHPVRFGPHLKYFKNLVYACCLAKCDFKTTDEKEVAIHNARHGLPRLILSSELPCPLVKTLNSSKLTRGEKFKRRTVQPRFKCKHCFRMYILSTDLQRHTMESHSGTKNKKEKRVPLHPGSRSKNVENLVFVCSRKECNFETKNEKKVALHYAKHKLPKVILPRLLDGPSSQVFLSKSTETNKHMIKARFKCTQCFTTFSLPRNLGTHIRTIHDSKQKK